MNNKIIALLCIVLFVSFPLASAAEIVPTEEYEEQDVGAAIAVNVRSYEPTILTSNLIEDNDVPVYMYLAGSTIGTLLQSNVNIEPIYGGIEIEKMRVRAANIQTSDLIVGEPDYSSPVKFDVDTLGYLTVTLKRFDPDNFEICASDSECDEGYTCETGACIPKEINLSFTADIYFKEAERLYSLAKSALILPVDADEDVWANDLDEFGAQYSFYGGRGLVRVRSITPTGVDLTVYSNKDLYVPIIGAPRPIADLHLEKGETSEYIDLGFTDEQALRNARFRVTLNDVRDPAQKRATVAVTVRGSRSQLSLTEGASLFPGSSWTVQTISITQGRSGYEYTLVVKDAKGNVQTITTSQAGGLAEEESALLNKKFYEKTTRVSVDAAKTIFYSTGTKTINPIPINTLGDTFRLSQYGIEIDTSEIVDESALTNKLTLADGVTLKEVLNQMLPPGFYYSVIDADTLQIKKFTSTDPCVDAEIYTDDGISALGLDTDKSLQVNNDVKLGVLCTGVKEFEEIVANGGVDTLPDTGLPIVEEAYFMIAQSYDAIGGIDGLSAEKKRGAQEKALSAYKELISRESKITTEVSFQDRVTTLENGIYGDVTYGTASLFDNGNSIFVELISVRELSKEDLSSAEVTKDGLESTYYVGDKLFGSDKEEGTKSYNWFVSKVTETSVQVQKKYTKGTGTSQTKSIDDSGENIEGSVFKLRKVNSKKEAYLTITPGTGQSLRSKSNFSVHIPIEARAFDLNPDKIDERIDRAKKIKEKLDEITATLEEIVRVWNYVCLGVFAYVSVKSSFFSVSSEARHDAIHGVDDQSGWAAFCEEESRGAFSQREYSTFDECMQENAGAIQDDISAAQDAQESAENLGGNYDNQQWYQDLTEGYGDSLKTCQDLLGDDVFLDARSKKDLAYQYALQENLGSDSKVRDSVDAKIESYLGEGTANQNAKQEACKNVTKALDKNSAAFDKLEGEELENERKRVASGIYDSTLTKELVAAKVKGFSVPTSKTFPSLKEEYLGSGSVVHVGKVFESKISNQKYTVYTTDKTTTVEELTIDDYKNLLDKKRAILDPNKDGQADDAAKQTSLEKINDDFERITGEGGYTGGERTAQIDADNGAGFYIDRATSTIYVGTAAYTSAELNENWAQDAKLQVYSSGEYKGLPYCLPYKDGNFIKFIAYTKDNDVQTIQYWNIGPDGQLCTNDDILVAHESELFYRTASPSYNTLVSFSQRYVKTTFIEGQTEDIDNHLFTVSYGKSRTVLDGATASCYDVLDPQDCKLMFNTCDPVMCPPSRFNLGGRWQVDSVVESGIIGSIILPQGSGDAVPVCLTGILASLNFWKSMLDGYVECLESAKFEGRSVGVCDKIRSVYMCELLVREAAAIMDNNKDGLLDFLAAKAYGQEDRGGGEYFQFKSNLQNVQNSFSYFTTEYATTAFSAFKGRSLEEVGTTICKQAIYAQTPWFADFMQQVTTPEDPNQFYATLTVRPYAPSQGTSAYQTYYHIYAGKNANIPNVVYQVYLKNSITGEVFRTTEECEGVSASLELGGMTDKTLDCLAPSGLDTVCVVLNGEQHCGFGTVSTAFSYDYMKDVLVADEVRREIKTEKDCYPSVSRASPSLSALGPVSVGGALPASYGEISTGVQRVCALQNPGLGQGSTGDWTPVGTCGEDASGRSLGDCWMNTGSISIRDAEREEETNEYLRQVQFEKQQEKWGISSLRSTEESETLYGQYGTSLRSASACGNYLTLLKQYRELFETSLSYSYAAAAQYKIGLIYYQIGTNQKLGGDGKPCGLTGRTQISYKANIDGEDLGSLKTFQVPVGEGALEIDFENLVEGDLDPVAEKSPEDFANPVNCFRTDDNHASCLTHIEFTAHVDEVTVTVKIERAEGGTYEQTLTFTARAPEVAAGTFASSAEVCGRCGDDVFNVCDEAECHAIAGCYFTPGFISGSCGACGDLKKISDDPEKQCAALESEASCENADCYSTFLSGSNKCSWDDTADVCLYSGAKAEVSRSARVAGSPVSIAEGELEAWNDADECDPAYAAILEDYLAAGGCSSLGCDDAWSAAFVSYLMTQADINFPGSCSHMSYFTEIRDHPGEYDCETFRMDDIADIQGGDILCQCRENSCPIDYDDAYERQESHCDIVVDREGDVLTTIGGNLGDTVQQRTVNIDRLSEDYFGFISCPRLSVVLSGTDEPCLTEAKIAEILDEAQSPLTDYAREIAQYSEIQNIKPEIFLAFMKKESNYGTTGAGAKSFNPGNIRPTTCTTCAWYCDQVYTTRDSGTFCNYGDWDTGIQAWFTLIETGRPYIGGGNVLVEDIVPSYCPPTPVDEGGCGEEGTQRYIDQIYSFVEDYGCPLR